MFRYILYVAAIKKPDALQTIEPSGSTIKSILQILFTLIGTIALFMVTYGGFKYVISQGEQTRVRSAKDTILYAVIGLVVAIAAQIIVTYFMQGFFS